MAKYIVEKSGPLKGEVQISGAKNAVLPLMAAALLAEEECVIRDVPRLRDVALMKEILKLKYVKTSQTCITLISKGMMHAQCLTPLS